MRGVPVLGRRFWHIPKTGLNTGAHSDHMDWHTDYSFRPAHTYTHTWPQGDIVMWDQLGTVHAKPAFDPNERRILRMVAGIFDDPAAPRLAEAIT